MNYTQDQAKKIYQSAKDKGLNPDLVMAKLVEKGATFEGIDTNTAMQYSNKLLGKDEPGYLQRVGSGIKDQALRAAQGAETGAQALEKGVNMTDANGIITPKGVVTAVGGALRSGLRAAGSAANAIATPIVEAPGVKQATQAVVGGAVKGIQELPGGAEAFQKLRDLAVKNPEIAKDVEDIFNLITVGGGAKIAKVGAEGAIGVAKAGEKAVGQGLESGMKLAENVIPKSDEIMNRVARLTPKQATTFEKLAGKTHGEYLRETGNFGTPDQIIKNEAEKFTQSLTDKKAALAELPGVYKEGSVTDALEMLVEKAKSESSPNVKSPYLEQVLELQRKNDTTGLSMLESENVKSLLERNVKLGYNKLMNPKEVTQATNIDNSIREWQANKAKELGFENISELNKQTQLSKFIVDKLGDQVVGKNGLNDVTLTDWIMLSGGDPTAVGGFLTKKFFSSKKVQSKIAEMLNKGEVKGQIVPKVTTSKKLPPQQSEKVLEKASTNNTTSGLKSKGTIPENSLDGTKKLNWDTIPEGGTKVVIPLDKIRVTSSALEKATNNVKIGNGSRTSGAIDVAMLKDGTFAIEEGHHRAVQKILQGDKSIEALVHSTKHSASPDSIYSKLDTTFIKKSPENSLISEAKKYKSAEDFVSSQVNFNHASAGEIKSFTKDFPNQKPVFLTKDANYYKEHISPDAKNTPVKVDLGKTITLDDATLNKILKGSDNTPKMFQDANTSARREVFNWLKMKGYDSATLPKDWNRGTQYLESTVVFDPAKQIRTKSELINIWNKLNK